MKIKSITAIEILDSRGNPTIETTVTLEDGSCGISAVPSGASTGSYEAVELRDGDKTRFGGLGVLKAVENVETKIRDIVVGMDAENQREIDETMINLDGTENKANLGANATLSVSMAIARAQAISEKKPLYEYLKKFNPDFDGTYIMPIPMMNIMNGGKHANWATDIQEYMIFPIGAKNIQEAVKMCAEIYAQLKKTLKSKNYAISVGDEGGFAPNVSSNNEPFELMSNAIVDAGYKLKEDIVFCIDPAATEFFKDGKYILNKEGKTLNSDELSGFFKDLIKNYPIVSLEDIFAEDDWKGFQNFTNSTENRVQVMGDDLFVTNPKRLQRGIDEKTCNSILIKLNQIGTLTETIDTILLARKNNITSVISHRSGETEDSFIADFVVAMGTGQIKTGAPCRSERTAKYNRLMKIEKELNGKSKISKFPF
ncbi:MAG: phosphopyruvate hydratase [Patescibacteria group bacterium]|nr:phosphopyruvate hydratase [Patescibacteria group bacterium]MDD4304713.1 phosphopyruvate hydratase [Patescibacteria group bacterium]MDD4695725.1 phosphopyruvate hydratase [Patescibacteria group bacterium]